jgi:hypothetical protein
MTSISKRGKLIEAELTRIRRVAEGIQNDYLLYFIDMAIAEVESKPKYRNDNKETFAMPAAISSLRKTY